jgi:hypothetical protein
MLVITIFGVEEIPSHKSRNLSHGDLTAELIFRTSCTAQFMECWTDLYQKNEAAVKTSNYGNCLKT